MIRSFAILLITFQIWACAKDASEIPFQKNQVKDEVKAMLLRYHDAVYEHGLLAEFEFLDQSEDFFWISPGYTDALNYETVASILRRSDSSLMAVEFQWETLSLYPLSNNLCNYSGKVTDSMVQNDSTVLAIHLIESGTIIKRKDGWKLLSGQSTNL